MSGFREIFTQSVSKGVGLIPTKLLMKITNQNIILPFYHAVSDHEMMHIKHLYPVKSTKEFTDDLDFLLKHYSPIDYLEFREITLNKKQSNKPSFLLSFDDGLSEFHDIISPILIKKGIPAICFLNSGFIDNKDLFYRYKASLLIDQIKNKADLLEKIKKEFNGTIKSVQDILSITYQNKSKLDELAHIIDYSFEHFLSTQKPYLTNEQVNNLIKQGFHFGAHSVDHPNYQFISFDQQLNQTKESIESICRIFSLDYKTFSFPFTDFNVSNKFFEQIKTQGIADTTFGCAGQKQDNTSNNFQRIPFEMAHLSGKQILKSELLYYLFKKPFGKNKIVRND